MSRSLSPVRRFSTFDYHMVVGHTHAMSKRLQVVLQDKELAEIQQFARRRQLTTSEWVRLALRAARRAEPHVATRKKLEVVRTATRHAFPAPEVDQMLDEIERGYLADSSR